jgi:hypothetical protein
MVIRIVRRTRRTDELCQRRRQMCGIRDPLDPPMFAERNATGLLGDNDTHGIGRLRDPNRCAMACADRRGEVIVFAEWKQAPGRHDSIASNQRGAVMKRRSLKENLVQQVSRHNRVEPRRRLDVLLKPSDPLDDNQRPKPAINQHLAGFGHLIGYRLAVVRRHA